MQLYIMFKENYILLVTFTTFASSAVTTRVFQIQDCLSDQFYNKESLRCERITKCSSRQFEVAPPTKTANRVCHCNREIGYYPIKGNDNDYCIESRCGKGETPTYEGTCVLCPIGFYKNNIGSASCIACPIGTYNLIKGLHLCMECDSGTTFKNIEGKGTCINCSKCEKENIITPCNKTHDVICKDTNLGVFIIYGIVVLFILVVSAIKCIISIKKKHNAISVKNPIYSLQLLQHTTPQPISYNASYTSINVYDVINDSTDSNDSNNSNETIDDTRSTYDTRSIYETKSIYENFNDTESSAYEIPIHTYEIPLPVPYEPRHTYEEVPKYNIVYSELEFSN